MAFISIQSLFNSPCFDATSPSSTLPPDAPPDMVASSNGDLYTPFPHMPIVEEGVQSSEEGSDLHSPIFDAPYATPDGTYTLSRCTVYNVHMNDWCKKAGITLTTTPTPMSLRSSYHHRQPPLTLAIPLRPWTHTPEIPISWRHYKSRALLPFTITCRPRIHLPTLLSMVIRCWI